MSSSELAELSQALGQAVEGWVSYDQFCQMVLEAIGSAYQKLDKDQSGELNSDELLNVSVLCAVLLPACAVLVCTPLY